MANDSPNSNCEKNMINILEFNLDNNFVITLRDKLVPNDINNFIKYERENQYYAIVGLNIQNNENNNETYKRLEFLLNKYFILVNLNAYNTSAYIADLNKAIKELKKNWKITVTVLNKKSTVNESDSNFKILIDKITKLYNTSETSSAETPSETSSAETPTETPGGRSTNLHNLTKQKKYRRTRSKSSKRNNKKSII